MAAKVKSIAILGDVNLVINQSGLAAGMNFATNILGYNVSRLKVRAEIDLRGIAAASLPDKFRPRSVSAIPASARRWPRTVCPTPSSPSIAPSRAPTTAPMSRWPSCRFR